MGGLLKTKNLESGDNDEKPVLKIVEEPVKTFSQNAKDLIRLFQKYNNILIENQLASLDFDIKESHYNWSNDVKEPALIDLTPIEEEIDTKFKNIEGIDIKIEGWKERVEAYEKLFVLIGSEMGYEGTALVYHQNLDLALGFKQKTNDFQTNLAEVKTIKKRKPRVKALWEKEELFKEFSSKYQKSVVGFRDTQQP